MTKRNKYVEPYYTLDSISNGCWYVIHLIASDGDVATLDSIISSFSKKFACEKCRVHINNFVNKNPLSGFYTRELKGDDIRYPLFIWSIKLHNSVNRRLSKPNFTKDNTLKLFIELTENRDSGKTMTD